MIDIYLQNLEFLQGQPKRTIADYVEENGILVPKRFNSLEEALGTQLPFIMRSEGTFEYNGVSGLLESHIVSPLIIAKATFDDRERIARGGKYRTDDTKNWQLKDRILRKIEKTPSKRTEKKLL